MAERKPTTDDTDMPQFPSPLIIEPTQTQTPLNLGVLQYLVGTWVNEGTSFGYNVMPLPQYSQNSGDGKFPPGYILKNTPYYEEMTFSAINGTAPNRSGSGTQVANVLFYEQRVYFASGPKKNNLVHAENGSWLLFTAQQQLAGPYGPDYLKASKPPELKFQIAKQVSIPHGNSVLAVGNYLDGTGSPQIEDSESIIPDQIDPKQYQTESEGNPSVPLTMNPNKALQDANSALTGTGTFKRVITLTVDTNNLPDQPPTNIPFEDVNAKVTRYKQTMWLEEFSSGDTASLFNRLQYTQRIYMELNINGQTVTFPHVTTNNLVRK